MTKGFGEHKRIEHRLRRDMNRRYRALVVAWRVFQLLVLIVTVWVLVRWLPQTVGDRLDRVPGHGAYSAEALLMLADRVWVDAPEIVCTDGLPPTVNGQFLTGAMTYEPADPAYCPKREDKRP